MTHDQLKEIFSSKLPDTLVMNHYDLHTTFPNVSIDDWRNFLSEPEIEQWIASELTMIHSTELSKLIAGITDGSSNSVGRAQIINTLAKLQETKSAKSGPVFIYTHVPLDEKEEQAENVAAPMKIDLFER